MLNPKISIILPNYNSQEYIIETLNSIIEQTYDNWEVILIDDKSNLETVQIIKKFQVNKKFKIFFLSKNMGTAFCRNLALRKSESDYLAFIDSDDIWEKDKLERQINFMLKNKFIFTYTDYITFKSSNTKKILNVINPPKEFNYKSFTKNTSICTSSMMIKSDIAKKYKFTNTKICEDYFYKCIILQNIGKAHCLDDVLTKYRISKNSMQSKKLRNLYWIWKINKKYNKFNYIQNIISILFISFNSIKKYKFK